MKSFFLATSALVVVSSALGHRSDSFSWPTSGHGQRLSNLLSEQCKLDVEERCDERPIADCKSTFESLCAVCFEALEDGERPSKSCFMDCAMANREALVAENCTLNAPPTGAGMRGGHPLPYQMPLNQYKPPRRGPRPEECEDKIREACGAECREMDSDECMTCVESNYESLKDADDKLCGRVNPFKVCREAVKQTCTECFSGNMTMFSETSRDCVEDCIDESDLDEQGGPCDCMDGDHLTGESEEGGEEGTEEGSEEGSEEGDGNDNPEYLQEPQSEECVAKSMELCAACFDDPDSNIPSKPCMRKCVVENRNALKEAGCRKRHYPHPRHAIERYIKEFQRIQRCFVDDFEEITDLCLEGIRNGTDTDNVNEEDVNDMFTAAISELQRANPDDDSEPSSDERPTETNMFIGIGAGVGVAGLGAALLTYRSRKHGTTNNKTNNQEKLVIAKTISEDDAESIQVIEEAELAQKENRRISEEFL